MQGIRTTSSIATLLMSALCLLVPLAVFSIEPMAQDPAYHHFIDQRTLLSIPHCLNVLSNLLFLFVGVTGLYLLVKDRLVILDEMKPAYLVLFFAVSLVAFGSGYYHLSPSNDTLLWDRLPMAIAFMALFSVVVAETISVKLANRLLYPLIFTGLFSVVYWHITEQAGQGDLRLYILVQFLPMLLIPVILVFFRSRFNTQAHYWFMLMAYVAAKLLEHFDREIYQSLQLVSGHSLKHIAAAIAVIFLLLGFIKRQEAIVLDT